MHIPQLTVLGLLTWRVMVHARLHGEPLPTSLRSYNQWHALFGTVALMWLLWWGGFFAGGVA